MTSVIYSHRIFALQQRGGISRYFCEIAPRIHRNLGFECKIVAPLHYNNHLLECGAPQRANYLRFRRRTDRLYNAVNDLLAPWLTRSANPDIVHHTYFAPADMEFAKTNVVTVYDMIHELYAEEFGSSDTTSADKRACVARADHVICISHSTAADLTRLFGTPSAKISVTHLGVSPVFSLPSPAGELSPRDRPYVLYVGQRGGYKNFQIALQAYAASPRLRAEFDFVTFGGFEFSDVERDWIDGMGLRTGAVVRLSGSDEVLARVYRHARVFVYPSLYEGFGIPPLEAMSAGCPVVCSNGSSLPEVVGDAALMFDASDAGQVRAALEKVCLDDEARASLIAAGHERVATFSWDRCAQETLAVYRRLSTIAPAESEPLGHNIGA